ncbi:uncharacterized protein LOC143887243 isoform X2 [Tasmannia lanceolata]|uniref:uncharacterized protein LOC143887243 isoform X2 n=1 Tax=Tasmannia lanceolata TaxID=3420 RepID=UPI004063AA86
MILSSATWPRRSSVVHVCSTRYHFDLELIRKIVMDRSWIQLPRNDPTYMEGVKEFIKFAFANTIRGNKILCPCNKCVHVKAVDRKEAEEHLLWNGMLKGYTKWYFHGESVKRDGEELSRVKKFKITHTKKDGQPIDAASGSPITQHLESSTSSMGARHEVFSQVVGEERRGRVQADGLGATPTELLVPSSDCMECRRQVEEANKKIEMLEKKLANVEDNCAQLTQQLNDFISNYMALQVHATPSSPEVVLMSIAQHDVEVARGLLKSQDPTTLVAGIRLGEGFSEILLKVPVVKNEPLVRPYGQVITIMDALGASVAWPSFLVKFSPRT